MQDRLSRIDASKVTGAQGQIRLRCDHGTMDDRDRRHRNHGTTNERDGQFRLPGTINICIENLLCDSEAGRTRPIGLCMNATVINDVCEAGKTRNCSNCSHTKVRSIIGKIYVLLMTIHIFSAMTRTESGHGRHTMQ